MKQSMSINAEITRQNDKILLDKGVLLVNRSDEPGIYSFDLKSYGVKVNSTVNFLVASQNGDLSSKSAG